MTKTPYSNGRFSAIQGVICLLIFWGLQTLDQRACGACNSDACYGNATNPLEVITYTSLSRVNFITLAAFFAASLLLGIAFIAPPVQFWTKFIRVFGYVEAFFSNIRVYEA